MQELAAQAWTPAVAWLVLAVAAIVLLATLIVPLRGLPYAVAALRGEANAQQPDPSRWLPMAAATGMGGITAGVLAIEMAGPGALVWMWIATLGGMAIAFAEGSQSARAPGVREPATMYLLAAPVLGRLLAPMMALAMVGVALILGTAFQTNQAAAALDSMSSLSGHTVAVGLTVVAAPFVFIPRLRRPLLGLVPVAVVLYIAMAVLALSRDPSALSLHLGDAVNQAFGVTPALGGLAGGGLGIVIAQGVLRATMAGHAGVGTIALTDLRAHSRGTAGALAMMVPLLGAGLIGSLSAMLMLGHSDRDGHSIMASPELLPMEQAFARGLRPSQQAGQTVVLPEDTSMEAGKYYAMKLRANPRGHKMAKFVEEKNHVVLPHWAIAHTSDTVVFRARDKTRAQHAAWDVRIPCEREVFNTAGEFDYVVLRPKDPELDLHTLMVKLELDPAPYVVFDDFSFIGGVGRATSVDSSLGEHLAMYEAKHRDRAFNPKFHEMFRAGYRGPYADDDGPRPPWGFLAREGFAAPIGSVVELRIVADPRGNNEFVKLSLGGAIETPAWDWLTPVTTAVIRHKSDPARDLRIDVTPSVVNFRLRFEAADEQFSDMRVIDQMEDYSGPYLVVPDYEFSTEVHSDIRRPPTDSAGERRTLIPLHPLSEPQGPYGDEPTYTPHPADLLALGLAEPVPTSDGAARIIEPLGQTTGSFGSMLLAVVVCIFVSAAIVGWAELGSRAATAIVGPWGGPGFKLLALASAATGSWWSLNALVPWIDISLAAAVVPSAVGIVLLIAGVRQASRMEHDLSS